MKEILQVTRGDRRSGSGGGQVYWETEPGFGVSRWLGVAPLDERFNTTKSHLAYTLGLLAFTLTLGVYLASNNFYGLSGFSLILERAQLFIVILTVVISTLRSITNVTTLQGVMSRLSQLDGKLATSGVLVPYTRVYGWTQTSVRLLLIASLSVPDILTDPKPRDYRLFIYQYNQIFPLLVGNMVQVQFAVLLELIQRRIRTLTGRLREPEQLAKSGHQNSFVSIHSSLITICETVNKIYSPQILIILSSIFIVTTATLFNVIEELKSHITGNKSDSLDFLLINTYRIVVRSLEVWSMVTTCVNTQGMAQEFNVNLYQVMIDDKGNELSGNKKLRLHVSMKREIVFTAWGFFPLDYTLVHSMIAAATTYLVILIQFGNPTESAPPAPPIATNATTA